MLLTISLLAVARFETLFFIPSETVYYYIPFFVRLHFNSCFSSRLIFDIIVGVNAEDVKWLTNQL